MAGEHSFMKALFHGVISNELILPFPQPDPREGAALGEWLRALDGFADGHVDSAAIDREGRIPDDTLEAMRALGLFGLAIPEPFGGAGLTHTGVARVLEGLGRIDTSVALAVGAHLGVGVRALLLAGTERQKQRHLPTMASGRMLSGFALTEVRAASDPSLIETRADMAPDGEGFVLNGSKRWVTHGGAADAFVVFCRAEDQPSDPAAITAFLVKREDGVRSGPEEPKLGLRGLSTTALFLEDVKVPSRNLIGAPGEGLDLAMRILNDARPQLAAICLGTCKRLLATAVDYATERRAFGRPIGELEVTQQKIAHMACETYALECMLYLTTGLIDADVPDYSIESAICKVYASETVWHLADTALQVAGGDGYMCDRPYERLLRDARLMPIYWGTNEALRTFIALAGLQSPGEQRGEVARALKEPLRTLGLLREFALQRARSALGHSGLARVHPTLKEPASLFEETVASLAHEAERVLRKHGGEITERQVTQGALADTAIHLYALAAVLSHTTLRIEARGEEGASREIDLALGFAALARRRMDTSLRDLMRDDHTLVHRIAGHAHAFGGGPFR